jgi:excisionase family DNA binding protein
VKETADVLGCSPKTIYRRIEDRALKASQSKPGAPHRIDRADLEAYIDAHSTAPSVHDIEPWNE